MFCRHVFGNISGGFRGILRFLGISRDFAEIPEFRGSATARNIRSPDHCIYTFITYNDECTVETCLLKLKKSHYF